MKFILYIILISILNSNEVLSQRIIDAKSYGCKGDGITDDSKSIQNCLNLICENGGTLYFNNGVYIISQTLKISSNSKNIIIAIKGNSRSVILANNRFNILEASNNKSFTAKLSIENITIDGNCNLGCKQALLDGQSFVFGLKVQDFKEINIKKLKLENIYGTGIRIFNSIKPTNNQAIAYSTKLIIDNCKILNVSGLHYTPIYNKNGSVIEHDNYGDAIHISQIKNGIISNNVIDNDIINKSTSGRGGIVLEYETLNCKIFGNKINGYDRNIHVESSFGGHQIYNNTLTGSDLGILISGSSCPFISNNPISISNNTISNAYIPQNLYSKKVISPRALIYFYSTSTLLDYSVVKNNKLEYLDGQVQGDFLFLSQQANLVIENNNFKGNSSIKSPIYFHNSISKFNSNTLINLSYINCAKTVAESKNNNMNNIYSNFIK